MRKGLIKNNKFFRLSLVASVLNLIVWFAAALTFKVTEDVEIFAVFTFGLALSLAIVVFAAGIIWALNPNNKE